MPARQIKATGDAPSERCPSTLTLRPIKPFDISGITPADLAGLKQPTFDLVDPRDLWVDEDVQRDITRRSEALGQRIVAEFDWGRFNAPVCARVDGRLHVLNGQTTATACASHPAITTIPVIVVDVPEKVKRALAFVSHSRDRVQATPGQIWYGLVAANDPEALAIKAVCDASGVRILPYTPPHGAKFEPGDTMALASVRDLVTRRGHDAACRTLSALVAADLAPIPANLIRAAESLLHEPEYAADFGPEQLTNALRSLGSGALAEVKALCVAKGLPTWRGWVAILFKNRKARAKVPEPAVEAATAEVVQLNPNREPTPAPKLSTQVRVINRRHRGPVPIGEPEPGRSALDERRRAQA